MTKYKISGYARAIKATGYSISGLVYAIKNESSFKQELVLSFLLVPLAFYITNSFIELFILILPIFLVLIVEILNSSIEAVVDKTGMEKNPLSKAAKDMGSAGVFIAIIFAIVVWAGYFIYK
jgi:diacylglycerol kinase (ATP)